MSLTARGPGRVKVEIEAEGITVVLRDGELRVILGDGSGRMRVEKGRPTYVHIETWSRELDLAWPEETT